MKQQLQKKQQLNWIKVALCSLIACVGLSATAQNSYDLEWAGSMGGAKDDEGHAIAVDRTGNVFVTGFFREDADFDPGPDTARLVSTGGYDGFLAKYDNDGHYQWVIHFGPENHSFYSYGVAVDTAGNVYVTGGFNGTIDFDPGPDTNTLTSTPIVGLADIFLAKYDNDGNYQWAIAMGGNFEEYAQAVAVDSTGVYITGRFMGTAAGTDFDPGSNAAPLFGSGFFNYDAFIAKYDEDGHYQWARGIGGPGMVDYGYGIATDGSGNVTATGTFTDTARFDPGPATAFLVAAGTGAQPDGFVAQYDRDGNYQWAFNLGGNGRDHGQGIATDQSGNLYVTGYFEDTADFDPGTNSATLMAAGSTGDGYIAKYDRDGHFQWTKNILSGGDNYPYGIAVDTFDKLYVTGRFSDTTDFDPGPDSFLMTGGQMQIFTAKYSNTGDFIWAGKVGSSNADQGDVGFGITVDHQGSIYTTGMFKDTADFDPGPDTLQRIAGEPGREGADAFVMKLACGDSLSSFLEVSIACGADYDLNGQTYDTTGVYTQMFSNTVGCDSTVVLDLTVLPLEPPVINIDEFLLGTAQSYTSYQWIKNGVDIPGATDSVYMVTENADYQVRVTNENGCAALSEVYEVTNVGTAIDDVNAIGQYIRIYPNPAQDVLHIKSPVPVQARLSSIEGRLILYTEETANIPLNGLAKGIYLLRILDTEGRLLKAEKVIVE